ncbi:MAG: hypothetical protein ACRC17_05450 [Culicoidibacterales bacterium]
MFHKRRNISFILLLILLVFFAASIIDKNIKKSTYLNHDIPSVKLGESFYDARADEIYIIDKVEVLEEVTIFYFKTPLYQQGYRFKGINPNQSLSGYISVLQDLEKNTLTQRCKDICLNFERYVLVNAFGKQLVILDLTN